MPTLKKEVRLSGRGIHSGAREMSLYVPPINAEYFSFEAIYQKAN